MFNKVDNYIVLQSVSHTFTDDQCLPMMTIPDVI